jgi:hypothetical protein
VTRARTVDLCVHVVFCGDSYDGWKVNGDVAKHRSTSGETQGPLARSDPAINRTGKPIEDRRPLVIPNGCKGFFVVSLGNVGWREVVQGPSRTQFLAHYEGFADETRPQDLEKRSTTI